MNRTKKFFYNSITTAIMQLVTMLVGFITPRIMINTYGSEINGLVSSIAQFISYFNLVEAGLAGAAIYALYKPIADNNHKEINAIVVAAKKFYTQSGYIFISLTLGLALIYPLYIRTNILSPLSVGLLTIILGANGALEFFTLSKYRVLLSADQKTYVISIASTIHIIINTIIIVVLASYRVDIVILRLVALLSMFLRSIILMIYCKRKYTYLNYKEVPNTKALNKRWDALFLQILGAIHTGAPVVLITLILKDLKVVSVYTIFNMVMTGINGILGIFVTGLSASFGDIIARNEIKILQKAYKEFEFIYYSLITVIYSITFLTIMTFVRIYTEGIDDINYNIPFLGFLFVLNGLLYNIKTPQGMLVIAAGMYKETKWQTGIQGIIAVVLGAILAPFMGISGVLVGSIFSNLYRAIDLLIFVPKNITKLRVKDTMYRIIRVFVSIMIVWLPFLFINIEAENILAWAIYACGVGIYAVMIVSVIGLIFETTEIQNVLRRAKGMVGKKK
ncbi:MAG: lipopolysaccharide biosynthesis protein [Zhenhengia sp.]|uniref:lipopolysaccharide biosynthesis protein n=1 Tax=Zhenhengia sp. TaxID=2944208 RepID=UPI0039914459